MSHHYLEVLRGMQPGRRYLLTDGASSIGRSAQNAIAFDPGEKSVSGHHAIIYKSPDRIFIQDLQSTNGTFVNEQQVTEHDLVPQDTLGFGKGGPRMRLIISDTELSLDAQDVSSITTNIKTIEDTSGRLMQAAASDSTASEDLNAITRIKQGMRRAPARSENRLAPSMTMEMEQKLLNKKIGAEDMHRLMRDGKRVQKIADRGNVGTTQMNMLKVVAGAHRRSNRRWVYVLVAVIAVSFMAISFFAIRAYQYQAMLGNAQKLQGQMETVEKQIAQANVNPERNKQKLTMLISELDQQNQKLSTIKSKIDEEDFGKFYADPIERKIDEIVQRYGESDYHVPKEMIERVKFHLNVYSKNMHRTIAKYIMRKEIYFPMILRILKEKNLPQELAYIAMLESGFNPKALSHAGARGLWQIMPRTARGLGMQVDDLVDERIEPEKATYAAAEYMKQLIAIFGGKSSVMLVMAAYNAGEGRVIGALRKVEDPMRNRDFWYIYHMGYLAEETNEYIPRVIALMIISENPQQFGFEPTAPAQPQELEQENDFQEIKLGHKGE